MTHHLSIQPSHPTDWIILGAGISGLVVGSLLLEQGQSVQLLEKARGVGGRLATRRTPLSPEPSRVAHFDHGLPLVELHHPETIQILAKLLGGTIPESWQWPYAGEWRGTALSILRPLPGMSALPKALTASEQVKKNQKVSQISYDPSTRLWLASTQEQQTFAARGIISTLPIPQLLEILERSHLELDDSLPSQLIQAEYYPALSVMMIPKDPSQIQLLRRSSAPIALAIENQWKGISEDVPCLTLTLNPELSQQLLQESDEVILERVMRECKPWLKTPPSQYQIHRWRYAQPKTPINESFIKLKMKKQLNSSPLYLCGDYFGALDMSSLERAILSSRALFNSIQSELDTAQCTESKEV